MELRLAGSTAVGLQLITSLLVLVGTCGAMLCDSTQSVFTVLICDSTQSVLRFLVCDSTQSMSDGFFRFGILNIADASAGAAGTASDCGHLRFWCCALRLLLLCGVIVFCSAE